MNNQHIHKLIKKITQKFNTANPFTICQKLGIIIVIEPLVDTRGVYYYFKRNKIICIDSNLSEQDKLLVCAHELGHALLHTKVNSLFLNSKTYLNTTWYEVEANQFATQLLKVYVEEFGGNIE